MVSKAQDKNVDIYKQNLLLANLFICNKSHLFHSVLNVYWEAILDTTYVMTTKLQDPNFKRVQYHFKGSSLVLMIINQRYDVTCKKPVKKVMNM